MDPSYMDSLHHLIAQIYAAGAGHAHWSVPLRALADATGSKHAFLQGHSIDGRGTISLLWRYDDGRLDHQIVSDNTELLDQIGDPREAYALELHRRTKSLTAFRDYDFIREREMKRHPYYAELLPQLGLKYSMATNVIPLRGGTAAGLSLQRTPRQGPVHNDTKKLFEAAAFHFAQAIELHQELTAPQIRTGHAVLPFALPSDAIVIDRSGRLMLSSSLFEDYVLSPGIMALRGQELVGKTIEMQEQLAKARHQAFAGQAHDLHLPKRGIHLSFLPLFTGEAAYLPAELIAVRVRIETSTSSEQQDQIRKSFRLSQSEYAIAGLLGTGYSIKEIAEIRSVSAHTVRTQTKSLMRKMGVNSQRQVIVQFQELSQP